MKSNKQLDEMQESKLLKIQEKGFWLVFWVLFAAIFVQALIGMMISVEPISKFLFSMIFFISSGKSAHPPKFASVRSTSSTAFMMLFWRFSMSFT